MNVKPNPAFLISTPEGEPTFYAEAVRVEAAKRAAEQTMRDALAAGHVPTTTADRLLELCPITLMDAACELDIAFKKIRGHALGLMRDGRARMLRGKLVRLK